MQISSLYTKLLYYLLEVHEHLAVLAPPIKEQKRVFKRH